MKKKKLAAMTPIELCELVRTWLDIHSEDLKKTEVGAPDDAPRLTERFAAADRVLKREHIGYHETGDGAYVLNVYHNATGTEIVFSHDGC